MKRADLTTRMVLAAVEAHGVWAWETLVREYPPKLVLAAYQREVDAGRLNYGVALHRPFLDDKGKAFLASEDSP
jgi:hypothetical protein